jgi:ribosomal protein S18 acetylase RimI-like enzyme
MNIRPLHTGDPCLIPLERMLVKSHNRSLSNFGALNKDGTVVLGGFAQDQLIAYGIFCNYRDPSLHVGSHINLDRIRDILQMKEVGLYQITLLYAEQQHIDLVTATEALIVAFEQWLAENYERYCLFITLMREGNRRARPLYKRLGFKKAGRPSMLMSFSLRRRPLAFPRVIPALDNLVLKPFDEITEERLKDFAECYQRVFLQSSDIDDRETYDPLVQVTSAPDFDRHLSFLLMTRDDQRVVGFMLAQRPMPQKIHVMAAGLLTEFRGQHLPYRCFPEISNRARAQNVHDATFVTTLPRVVRLTLRAFGAKEVDQLQTFIKVG